MVESSQLSVAWQATQERLPEGWRLDSLRCASSGLTPHERSEDWIAVAIGPGSEERTFRAPDALAALLGLSGSFGSDASSGP